MTLFQVNNPSIESQWTSLILFGKNSATYRFAFAKSLLEVAEKQKTTVSLKDLSIPFVNSIVEHLKYHDKQGSFTSGKFLKGCREYIQGKISAKHLYDLTGKFAFVWGA
jgi:hypothetical protein